MLISTRGRYALRVLIDLAENGGDAFVPMRDVAARQNISLKYLERILPVLSKNGLIETSSGKGGGYRLLVDPAKCKVIDVLKHTEKSLAPVACLANSKNCCLRSPNCKTLPMWSKVNEIVNNYFNNVSIKDLIDGNV